MTAHVSASRTLQAHLNAGGRRTMLNEGLARWTYEGHEGFGIAEYLHQLDAEGLRS